MAGKYARVHLERINDESYRHHVGGSGHAALRPITGFQGHLFCAAECVTEIGVRAQALPIFGATTTHFLQMKNEGLRQLFLMVSWDLCAMRGTADVVLVSL